MKFQNCVLKNFEWTHRRTDKPKAISSFNLSPWGGGGGGGGGLNAFYWYQIFTLDSPVVEPSYHHHNRIFD